MSLKPQDIIAFWFEEASPRQWYNGGEDFDHLIKERFEDAYLAAKSGLFDDWAKTAEGALALCIILDQFPRNMYRGTAEAFATDEKALGIAWQAVTDGHDAFLPPMQRAFLYLPFEHSEELDNQKRACALFGVMKDVHPEGYKYALAHREVIEKFGRFPHRNKALGRKNTPEEDIYLQDPNAGF